MRLPRPRFTLSRLMVAVAIAGVVMAIPIGMKRRTEAFQAIAERHSSIDYGFRRNEGPEPRWTDSEGKRVTTDRVNWHRHLASKYRHAALYPLQLVEPDPPEPE
jgi:hypothetical protein